MNRFSIISAIGMGFYQSEIDGRLKIPWNFGVSYAMAIISCVLSFSVAFSHFLVLIMYGSEVSKVPESHVKGSYGVIVISLIIELALPLIIHIDKTKKFPLRDVFFKTGSKQPKSANDKPDSSNRRSRPGVVNMRTNPVSSIEDQAAGFRTSVTSLSEAETFKKFAFYENPGMNPSTVSLASYSSVNARTAAYTNTPNLAETSSLESAVLQLSTIITYPKGLHEQQPEAEIHSAVGLIIFSLFIEVVMPWVIWLSISRRFFLDHVTLVNVIKLCGCGTETIEHSTLPSRSGTSENVSTQDTASTHFSTGTSLTSLTERETFNRYVDEGEPILFPIRNSVSAEVYSNPGGRFEPETSKKISAESLV
ncbi:hypothetical protein MAR_037135 [Mya arenaria]|uniref:Uncharacterized protein n=1 Tax=Mya arenaria TaxID=6604 RepID=A0ABY7FRX7_MYAAR|nr:hypothetical protein MAR_037135 [Mya arenaria]